MSTSQTRKIDSCIVCRRCKKTLGAEVNLYIMNAMLQRHHVARKLVLPGEGRKQILYPTLDQLVVKHSNL